MTTAPTTTDNVTPETGRPRITIPLAAIVAVVALPVFLITELPLWGWGIAVLLWLGNVAVHGAIMRSVGDSTLAAGAAGAGSMFLRMWVSAGIILVVGVSPLADEWFGDDARMVGLSALVLFTILFTLDVGRRIRTHAAEVEAAAAIETPLVVAKRQGASAQ